MQVYSFKSQQRRPQLLQYYIFCLLFFFILLFLHSWHLCWQVGFPLTVSMDPQGTIWYRLFKEDTRYTAGVHIKVKLCSLMLGCCWKVKLTTVFVRWEIHVLHWTPKFRSKFGLVILTFCLKWKWKYEVTESLNREVYGHVNMIFK